MALKKMKTDMTASRDSVELLLLSYLFRAFLTAFSLKMEHTVPRFLRTIKCSFGAEGQQKLSPL